MPLSNAGRVKELQLHKTLRRWERLLEFPGLAHEFDDPGQALEIQLSLPWKHAAVRLKVERQNLACDLAR